MSVLTVSSLSARLGGRSVLNAISFEARGGLTILLGPNGSGKSTLMRALAGVIPARGEMLLDGVDISRLSATKRARKIAYLPQQLNASVRMSVLEYVALGAGVGGAIFCAPGRAARETARRTLEKTGMAGFSERMLTELSGGEARMAGIARALAQPADFMLLDEPLSGLDFKRAHELLALIRRSARSALLSIHDPALAWQYGARVLLIEKGRIIAQGVPGGEREFLPALQAVYGEALEFIPVFGRLLPVWRAVQT